MINLRTLDVLLRTFDGEALAGARPATAVSAVGAAPAVGARMERPALALVAEAAAEDAALAATAGEGTASSTVQAAVPRDTLAPAVRDAGARTLASIADSGAAPLAGAAATATHDTIPDASAPLHLSVAARLVGQLVAQADAHGEPAAIRAAAPLLAAPPPEATALARALGESIAQSGLFYESHLASWTLQQRPQAELAHEPQATWMGAAVGDAEPARGEQAAAAPVAPSVLQAGSAHADVAVPLVRHQLHALETHALAWSGELWPGQRAQIDIAEEERDSAPGVTPTWRTRVRLNLPLLGEVDATLSLQGDALRLQLQTADPASARTLQRARDDLVAALEQRSLAVTGFAIGHERH